MENVSIHEIIEMALRTEKLGFSYYSELAQKFKKNDELHALFNKLAENEVAHAAKFTKLKESLQQEQLENWPEVSQYMRSYVESAFFMGANKAVPHMQNIQDPNAALGLAIAFEKETLLYFYGMADAIKDNKDRHVLDEIIKEEKSHIVTLSDLKEKLSKAAGR
ncbi:MAG: ferritin family protein [Candidatus Magnetobacterium sp. LHC-1]|uniref:Ferritin family protein n=1 Tax=Candidatus Magnetobacterium casense TaxID=1455061 RepID=A0ABS6S1Y7_9BACT|nr:ferritin family protein [Candidatus Magnetobacterium casensis]MBF0606768.1 ferritin family protein [Nitrospirota bacterium]MBV6342438.1 ferritin family protein [Candidatus Magnetobacterium casensis]